MTTAVFVSHATKDKKTVQKLCNELAAHDIDVWASFKDIPPGAEWDKSIQEALEAATHVVLVVSQASIDSSYVRAEVEYALDNNKAVIPVLIEEVKLPVRWHTLQHVDIRKAAQTPLKSLVKQLPKNSIAKLREYMKSTDKYEALKTLIWQNPQWIHPGAWSQDAMNQALTVQDYHTFYKKVLKIFSEGGLPPADTHIKLMLYHLCSGDYGLSTEMISALQCVDSFRVEQNSSTGLRYYFTFLCSPYFTPFNNVGDLSSEMTEKFNQASRLTTLFYGNFHKHDVSMGIEKFNIYLISGKRDDYSDIINLYRLNSQTAWSEKLASYGKVSLEIASYTRLIENVEKGLFLLNG